MAKDWKVWFYIFGAELHSKRAADTGEETDHESVNMNRQNDKAEK